MCRHVGLAVGIEVLFPRLHTACQLVKSAQPESRPLGVVSDTPGESMVARMVGSPNQENKESFQVEWHGTYLNSPQ